MIQIISRLSANDVIVNQNNVLTGNFTEAAVQGLRVTREPATRIYLHDAAAAVSRARYDQVPDSTSRRRGINFLPRGLIGGRLTRSTRRLSLGFALDRSIVDFGTTIPVDPCSKECRWYLPIPTDTPGSPRHLRASVRRELETSILLASNYPDSSSRVLVAAISPA